MKTETALDRALPGTGEMVDFSGIWRNELRSWVQIDQNDDRLSGVYHSYVSSAGTTTIGDLVGYVDGNLIGFTVHWRDFQSITSWVGQLDPHDDSLLNTLWQMTKSVDEGKEWSSINAGADSFRKDAQD